MPIQKREKALFLGLKHKLQKDHIVMLDKEDVPAIYGNVFMYDSLKILSSKFRICIFRVVDEEYESETIVIRNEAHDPAKEIFKLNIINMDSMEAIKEMYQCITEEHRKVLHEENK